MGPETQKLSESLTNIEEILNQQKEQHWANMIGQANSEIQNQDFGGVERFLSLFGGMGSLNDLVLTDSGQAGKLDSLLSIAHKLATSIKRQQ